MEEAKKPLAPEFSSYLLNEQGIQKAAAIAEHFDYLLSSLTQFCLPGRELSIVKTKLEEACFFAKKAMAINLDNQQTCD